ncbi:MAG: HlyD family efflux transporter periplasmic adaptor subunit, partial [Planctomycetia bacterium]|nr:HlyD family efflux transporter periplasmic adaptor subunit [Planctomycetia bacterium]
MKRRLGRLLLAVVLLGVVAGGLIAWTWPGRAATRDELVLYGNVDLRQVELAFFVSERIAELLVVEGDHVTKGQPLATLDATRFRAQAAAAQANLDSQREVVARLEAGSRPEEIRKARADLAAAQAKAFEAERNYSRVLDLSKTGVKTVEEVDGAKAAWQSATANVDAMQALLDLAVAGPRIQDIEAAKAELRGREADLNLARYNLADARLVAPSDGVIQDRILEVGDMASPQKPVFTIALTTPLWIRAYVDEPDLGKVVPGMAAIVKTDSYPGKDYHGWVGFISPTAEFTPKPVETSQLRTRLVYQVRVFVDNPRNELR